MEKVFLPAARAHSMMVLRRYTFSWVMLRDLIFLLDSSFLGFRPLHDERWAAVSSLSMSVPISTINDVAERSFISGMVCSRFNSSGNFSPQISSLFSRHFSLCFSARSVSSRSCAIMSVSAGLTTPLSEARMMSLPWWLTMVPVYELHQLFQVGDLL